MPSRLLYPFPCYVEERGVDYSTPHASAGYKIGTFVEAARRDTFRATGRKRITSQTRDSLPSPMMSAVEGGKIISQKMGK